MTAPAAVTVEPITLLNWIGHHTTASVSSRNRLTASPGEEGRARPPGSSRIRRSMLRCSMAALANANAPFVDCRVIDVIAPAAARMPSRAIGHSSQPSEAPARVWGMRSNTTLAAMPGSRFDPQPRNTPARLMS